MRTWDEEGINNFVFFTQDQSSTKCSLSSWVGDRLWVKVRVTWTAPSLGVVGWQEERVQRLALPLSPRATRCQREGIKKLPPCCTKFSKPKTIRDIKSGVPAYRTIMNSNLQTAGGAFTPIEDRV